MKVLQITAGAGGMYCGSCLRDNALAMALRSQGHDVTLMPLYTPTLTDEPNASEARVLFGGISVYLQQRWPWFRSAPRLLDRVWDSPRVIRLLAGRAVSTDARLLGDLTISMLEGTRGVLRKEFDKLAEWMSAEPLPDIVNLPNSLLIALAAPLRAAVNRPVCCTLQGEELFLDSLPPPYRERAIALIRQQIGGVDRFIAVSEYSAAYMADLLGIPPARISVVPLGINTADYGSPRDRQGAPFRIGYLARVAPEKGLHLLAEAYVQFRRRIGSADVRLEAAGYLAPAHRPYLSDVRRILDKSGLAAEFSYLGVVDRAEKLAFLRTLDLFSVPATYDEPKGMFLLEAMAAGVPVVQPRRGSFTEMVERTGGGLLVEPDDAEALAAGFAALWRDRALAKDLGTRASHGVRQHYTAGRSAERLIEVYRAVLDGRSSASASVA